MKKRFGICMSFCLSLFFLTSCQNTSGTYVHERDEEGKHIIHTINLKLNNKCSYVIKTYSGENLEKTYTSAVCSWNKYIIASDGNREQLNIVVDNPDYDPNATNSNKNKTMTKYYDYSADKITDRRLLYEFFKK